MSFPTVDIVGAGLAGSEAALVLARSGIKVRLHEMRPIRQTPAHTGSDAAELVCSNSLKTDKLPSSHGLLKAELSLLNSPLLTIANTCRVPAGNALAVDRNQFAKVVTSALSASEFIEIVREEISDIHALLGPAIIASGPLTSDALAENLGTLVGGTHLHFYDAIAPIISADSIDMSIAFGASRWDKGDVDYINCPFTKDEYNAFYSALCAADKTRVRPFEEERYFEACLPVEEIAARGEKSLAFGPMRPVGLTDPRTGRRPWAVCQLRREKKDGESYNLVGFQTRLTIPMQNEVFRLIPGLADVVFERFGSIHRNTYIDSPRLLTQTLALKAKPAILIAGQLCGNEGYTESIATGHLAARFIVAQLHNTPLVSPPVESALGALLAHVTNSEVIPFTPSNINFSLFPTIALDNPRKISKDQKKQLYCDRALLALTSWINENSLQ